MKSIILICVFLFQIDFQSVQTKNLPSIYAICQIELNDGQLIEGIINFGVSGYNRYYTHGFYFPKYHPPYGEPEILLLDLDVDSISIKQIEAFYIENLTYSGTPDVIDIINDSILVQNKKERFELSEKIVLHQKPSFKWIVGSNLFYAKDEKTIVVNVSDIKTFKLLKKPSEGWMNLISRLKEEYPQLNNEQKNALVEMRLLWYHELIKDEKLKTQLEKYFVPEN